MSSKRKISKKKLGFVVIVLVIVIFVVPYVVWLIMTPNWSFTGTTDKAIYKLGENVTITAVLKNNGYITHSFKAFYQDPIEITIGEEPIPGGTWYSPNQEYVHTVSVPPGQSIERTVVWNQTTLEGELAEPGVYYIVAKILDGDRALPIFEAEIEITITE